MCAKVNEQEITRTRQIIKNNCHLHLLIFFVSGSKCPSSIQLVFFAETTYAITRRHVLTMRAL